MKTIDKKSGKAPFQLHQHDFSIKHDLLSGWQPRLNIRNPFPLLNRDPLKPYYQANPNWIYKGFIPSNSYQMHQAFSAPQSYAPKDDSFALYKSLDPSEFGQPQVVILPEQKSNDIFFDSFYESGNLSYVYQTGNTFSLFLKVDTNTYGHTQWFNFSVYATEGRYCKFEIKNMSKPKSIFGRGGVPYYSTDQIEWKRVEQAQYLPTSPSEELRIVGDKLAKLYTLSFEFRLKSMEKVYFAYCPSYTYSSLLSLLKADCFRNKNIIEQSSLCLSETFLEVPIVRCTQFFSDKNTLMPIQHRSAVFVIGRVHPGETCGSFMVEGFLNFIVSDDPRAQILRETFDFYIVPMMNPDGVIAGNFRTSLSGDDLNRRYKKPSQTLHPTVVALKSKVKEVKKMKSVSFFFDLHGHSTRPDIFTYGPELSKTDPLFWYSRLLPKLFSSHFSIFDYAKCTWKIVKAKKSTARAVFLRDEGIRFIYTIESSTSSVSTETNQLKNITVDDFMKMGHTIGLGLASQLCVCSEDPTFIQYLNRNLSLDPIKIWEKVKDALLQVSDKDLYEKYSVSSSKKLKEALLNQPTENIQEYFKR